MNSKLVIWVVASMLIGLAAVPTASASTGKCFLNGGVVGIGYGVEWADDGMPKFMCNGPTSECPWVWIAVLSTYGCFGSVIFGDPSPP